MMGVRKLKYDLLKVIHVERVRYFQFLRFYRIKRSKNSNFLQISVAMVTKIYFFLIFLPNFVATSFGNNFMNFHVSIMYTKENIES